VLILKNFKLIRINTCISADSKGVRLHKNCAIFEAFFVRNRGRGRGKGAAGNLYGKQYTREIIVWQGESAGRAGKKVERPLASSTAWVTAVAIVRPLQITVRERIETSGKEHKLP